MQTAKTQIVEYIDIVKSAGIDSEEITRDVYAVESASDKSKAYNVYKYEGKWICDCPHYVYRQGPAGKVCKHIASIGRA